MPRTPITIDSSGVSLEGVLELPEGAAAGSPCAAVVICHPHPLYGGSMDNNVVAAVSAGLRERGIGALLFNFRGVGRSGGAPGDQGEALLDARAVLAYAAGLDAIDEARIGLAGYSFGSAVAATAAASSIPALALIALPLSMAEAGRDALAASASPLLLLSGSEDGGSDEEGLRALAESAGGPARVEIVPGADHFWWGHEGAITRTAGEFFADALAS